MKGIILAGGSGTRLRPITKYLNKHLFPVYDKPMILFPIETMKKAGIRDIIIVVDRYRSEKLVEFLGSGDDFGVSLTYKIQEKPGGIAQAISICERNITESEALILMLGDNIVFDDLSPDINAFKGSCKIFIKQVEDPERFGVPVFSDKKEIINIIEKPKIPPSEFAVTGVYLFDYSVFQIIKQCQPSDRGELEITDVLNFYAREGSITYRILNKIWIDAGTFDSLYDASTFVKEMEGSSNL
jgi:glucose-1-phosphate thymidylyltransferase